MVGAGVHRGAGTVFGRGHVAVVDDVPARLVMRLFQVRDGIITLMGEYRGEWRRRFGGR